MSRDTTSIPPRHVGIGTFRTTEKMRALVNEVLDSERISYGPVSRRFERRFADLHDSPYAILSNSGTSSLHVALQAMKELHGWQDGDEVIVPATTFVATPNIVIHNRMTPVFADVDPISYNIQPSVIEPLITRKTRAIIPVHLFGQPADMTTINTIARQRGLLVIEDSCETMFARHAGRSVGALGDIGCFSLYMAHLLTAGVGGVGTTANPDYAAKMRSLVNHGLTIENLNPDENFSPRFMLNRRFLFDSIGHSFRITELEAALALAQLDDPEYEIVRPRQRNAQHLTAGIRSLNEHYKHWLSPPVYDDGFSSERFKNYTHSWMMYPILVTRNAPFSKTEIMDFLNQHDIETRDMLPILHQPAYGYLNPDDFPVSKYIVENGFYIGCHQHLSPADIGYVVQTIGSFYDDQKSFAFQ